MHRELNTRYAQEQVVGTWTSQAITKAENASCFRAFPWKITFSVCCHPQCRLCTGLSAAGRGENEDGGALMGRLGGKTMRLEQGDRTRQIWTVTYTQQSSTVPTSEGPWEICKCINPTLAYNQQAMATPQ